MAITYGYCTLNDLKAYLTIAAATDDTRLENAIEQASRAIDHECRRVFYATTATRYYQAEAPDFLALPDDLLTVTTLKTDDDGDRTYETTWATTDYDLTPDNSSPKTAVRLTPQGRYSFPTHRRGVEIAGSWGYNATDSYPDAINHAAVILAARFFKRKDAPFGVLGTPELGFTRIPRSDSDVRSLLQPFRRLEVV